MSTRNSTLLLGAALCALLAAGCSSDGLTVGASNGAGAGSSQAPPDNTGDGSGGDSTTGGGGSGGGTGSGSGSGAQSSLGGGAVTVTAGGTTATTPAILAGGPAGAVSDKVASKAGSLLTTGNAILPTAATGRLHSATGSLPASATLDNTTLGGSATQPVGVSVLSNTQTPGTVATVGVASAGQTGAVTVNPAGLPTSGVVGGQSAIANATAGRQTIVSGSNPLVGASVASPTASHGSVVSAGVLSNGQPATAALGNQPLGVGSKNLNNKRIAPVGPSPQGH